MRDRAQVVIVGCGIVGASIAYHLAQMNWRDVAVIEKGELVGGTTAHAPGLIGQLRSSESLTKMLMCSVSLYRNLRVDAEPGYLEVGSLRLASSKARFEELISQAHFARNVGLESHLLCPREADALFPLMETEGVYGALYVPRDGSAVASILSLAMIQSAETQGISFHPHTQVQSIDVVNGRVRAINTTRGRIETEIVIIAAGIWSPLIGGMAGIELPLIPMQHQYVVTAPLRELAGRTMPNLRDPDRLVYVRQDEGRLVIGGYERNPRSFNLSDIPDCPDSTVQPFDPIQFEPLYDAARGRIPVLASIELSRQINGLESFTPDGQFLMGPSEKVQGLWAACGFCAHGISSAGGVGQVIAEWIIEGKPGLYLKQMSLDRFELQPIDAQHIEQRARNVYSTYYDILEYGSVMN